MNSHFTWSPDRLLYTVVLVAVCGIGSATADDATWRVGLGRAEITPREPILLSGYGGRSKPFERVDIPLFVKAMSIEDDRGTLAVLITLDAECMYPQVAEPLLERIDRETGLHREQVLINFSHSHAAPFLSLDPNTKDYGSTPETTQKTVAHTQWLFGQILTAVKQSLADRQPARFYFGTGVAPFVMNRREFTATGVKIGINPRGYVDRSVPVLRVDGADGNPRAVVFASACHNTTLGGDSLVVSGDYAGYAQADVEQRHPNVQAMFMIGCGADANPYPRGTIELARAHGRALADVVEKHLEWQAPAGKQRSVDRRSGAADMTPLSGPLVLEYSRLSLPLRVVPSVEAMKAEREGKDSWHAHHARLMLELSEAGKPIPTAFDCPLALWQFGNDLTLVAFSGEVVAGYVPLVEEAIGHRGLWVAAYCNLMYGYVPTEKTVEEGGYETRGLEIGVGQFAPEVQKELIDHVIEFTERARNKAAEASTPAPSGLSKPQRRQGVNVESRDDCSRQVTESPPTRLSRAGGNPGTWQTPSFPRRRESRHAAIAVIPAQAGIQTLGKRRHSRAGGNPVTRQTAPSSRFRHRY